MTPYERKLRLRQLAAAHEHGLSMSEVFPRAGYQGAVEPVQQQAHVQAYLDFLASRAFYRAARSPR